MKKSTKQKKERTIAEVSVSVKASRPVNEEQVNKLISEFKEALDENEAVEVKMYEDMVVIVVVVVGVMVLVKVKGL